MELAQPALARLIALARHRTVHHALLRFSARADHGQDIVPRRMHAVRTSARFRAVSDHGLQTEAGRRGLRHAVSALRRDVLRTSHFDGQKASKTFGLASIGQRSVIFKTRSPSKPASSRMTQVDHIKTATRGHAALFKNPTSRTKIIFDPIKSVGSRNQSSYASARTSRSSNMKPATAFIVKIPPATTIASSHLRNTASFQPLRANTPKRSVPNITGRRNLISERALEAQGVLEAPRAVHERLSSTTPFSTTRNQSWEAAPSSSDLPAASSRAAKSSSEDQWLHDLADQFDLPSRGVTGVEMRLSAWGALT